MLGTALGTGLTMVAWSCFWRKRLKQPSQKLRGSRRGLNRQTEGGSLLFLTLPVAAPLLIRHVCWWDVPYFPSFLRLLLWFYICFSYFFFSFLTFFFKFLFSLFSLSSSFPSVFMCIVLFTEVVTFALGDWQSRLSSDALRSVVKEIMETKVPCDRRGSGATNENEMIVWFLWQWFWSEVPIFLFQKEVYRVYVGKSGAGFWFLSLCLFSECTFPKMSDWSAPSWFRTVPTPCRYHSVHLDNLDSVTCWFLTCQERRKLARTAWPQVFKTGQFCCAHDYARIQGTTATRQFWPPPKKTNMTIKHPPWMKMYLIIEKGDFLRCHVSELRGVPCLPWGTGPQLGLHRVLSDFPGTDLLEILGNPVG